jgi:hypothetical protein
VSVATLKSMDREDEGQSDDGSCTIHQDRCSLQCDRKPLLPQGSSASSTTDDQFVIGPIVTGLHVRWWKEPRSPERSLDPYSDDAEYIAAFMDEELEFFFYNCQMLGRTTSTY